jgi:hypothetical protein
MRLGAMNHDPSNKEDLHDTCITPRLAVRAQLNA